jgi:hypothetical protein
MSSEEAYEIVLLKQSLAKSHIGHACVHGALARYVPGISRRMGSHRVLGDDEPFHWWNESAILLPGGRYLVSFSLSSPRTAACSCERCLDSLGAAVAVAVYTL